MAYNPNIPLATDFMAISNIQCRTNFQTINAVWSKNHVSLTSKHNLGMHNFMIFRPQIGITPNPSTTTSQVALYTKLVSNVPQLFFRPSNNQTPIQLTYPSISTGLQSTNPDVYLPRQYSFLAGPFVFYIGIVTGVIDNQQITILPSTALIYVGVMLMANTVTAFTNAAATNVGSGGNAQNQFNVRIGITSSSPTFEIMYLAIGK
jgi:hypothetical protein